MDNKSILIGVLAFIVFVLGTLFVKVNYDNAKLKNKYKAEMVEWIAKYPPPQSKSLSIDVRYIPASAYDETKKALGNDLSQEQKNSFLNILGSTFALRYEEKAGCFNLAE